MSAVSIPKFHEKLKPGVAEKMFGEKACSIANFGTTLRLSQSLNSDSDHGEFLDFTSQVGGAVSFHFDDEDDGCVELNTAKNIWSPWSLVKESLSIFEGGKKKPVRPYDQRVVVLKRGGVNSF